MIVLVDVRDNRYASGLRVRTWNVDRITKEIWEYVYRCRDKVSKIRFGDSLYSSSEYSDEDHNIQSFLSNYYYLVEE